MGKLTVFVTDEQTGLARIDINYQVSYKKMQVEISTNASFTDEHLEMITMCFIDMRQTKRKLNRDIRKDETIEFITSPTKVH